MVEILQDFKPFFGIKQTGIPDVGALHYLQKLGAVSYTHLTLPTKA